MDSERADMQAEIDALAAKVDRLEMARDAHAESTRLRTLGPSAVLFAVAVASLTVARIDNALRVSLLACAVGILLGPVLWSLRRTFGYGGSEDLEPDIAAIRAIFIGEVVLAITACVSIGGVLWHLWWVAGVVFGAAFIAVVVDTIRVLAGDDD